MPVVENDKKPEEDIIRNPNEIRDLIYTTLTLTEYTKVPILFLGNPGVAKTTGVRTWAKNFGYKVTTLIGTQRVAEEILGYMVNDTGEKRLITYTPDWYDEILENKKAGFKTLLFIDELSQAADNVQGAMLQLIFDRKVGGRDNYLPEDCLVVSAANYKGNIPPQCGIQAPTLNRFCIINVQPVDGIGLAMEFLQSEEEREDKIPVFNFYEITPQVEETIRKTMKESLENVFGSFSRKDDNNSILDINNTNYADIFDQPGPIYNFLSGRTIHYMNKMAIGLIRHGLVRKVYKNIVRHVCLGLAGLGTNTFKNDKDRDDYHLAIISAYQKVIRTTMDYHKNEFNATELDFSKKTVETCISEWMRLQESAGTINDINLHRLMAIIKEKYGADVKTMTKVVQNIDSVKFLADIQKIETLHNYLKTAQILEISPIVKDLSIIVAAYEAYKANILNSLI